MKSIKIGLFFIILIAINACNGDSNNDSNTKDTTGYSHEYPSAGPAVDTFATDTSNFTNGPDNAAPQSADTSGR